MDTWQIKDETELKPITEAVLARVNNQASEKATVIALHGDLGAGKTTFSQTMARLLGITETVTSPTFVIMKWYETTNETFTTLIHIDAYRLDTSEELTVLGFKELLKAKETLIMIEWAEKVADLLPADTLHLNFSIKGDERVITAT